MSAKSTFIYVTAQPAGAVEYINCISAKGVRLPPPNEFPWYDTKQSHGESPVLKLLEMWSTSSLPLLSGLLWPSLLGSYLWVKHDCFTF